MLNFSIISFWHGFVYHNNLFTNKYCTKHLLTFNYDDADFIICGSFVNEETYNIIKKLKCKKFLYITEPIEIFYEYTYKLYNENEFNIIFGCINNDIINNKYKHPIYLPQLDLNNENIFNDINTYVKNTDIVSKKFCCLINTHDMKNTRTLMYNNLKEIDNIICPSNLFNNCSNEELNRIGNYEYLKQFKFNICAENCLTNIKGYITEKLMNCCMGGAIPIYCGPIDEIDEQIFNKNRILFYNHDGENSIIQVKNIVISLLNNKEQLYNFYTQDVFCSNAYNVAKELNNNLLEMFNIK